MNKDHKYYDNYKCLTLFGKVMYRLGAVNLAYPGIGIRVLHPLTLVVILLYLPFGLLVSPFVGMTLKEVYCDFSRYLFYGETVYGS